MKHMEQFYFNQHWKAIESGNDELADEIERKYSRLVTGREARSLSWVLFGVLVITILSPFIHWWLIGWRWGL